MVERFNRAIKEMVQTIHFEGSEFQRSMTRLLLAYRNTPHRATSVSPSDLLVGRKARTKLNIGPPTLGRKINENTLRRTVKQYQSNYKIYADNRNCCKSINCNVGDFVRYRLPVAPKGKSAYSEPLRSTGIIGRHTYRLEGDRIFNEIKLTKVSQAPAMEICGNIGIS